jgi:hypothetical protein
MNSQISIPGRNPQRSSDKPRHVIRDFPIGPHEDPGPRRRNYYSMSVWEDSEEKRLGNTYLMGVDLPLSNYERR